MGIAAGTMVWWTISAIVAGAGGFALLIWALWSDRSRGRRRCPRCWYDMTGASGTGLVCSECGRDARRERRLFKTRRRWFWVLVSLLVLLISVSLSRIPLVHNGELERAVPTTILIGFSSTDSHTWLGRTFKISDELSRRDVESPMWDWQFRWWVQQTLAGQKDPWGEVIRTRTLWPRDEQIQFIPALCRRPTGTWVDDLPIRMRAVPVEPGGRITIVGADDFGAPLRWMSPQGPLAEAMRSGRFGSVASSDDGAQRYELELIIECARPRGRTLRTADAWCFLKSSRHVLQTKLEGTIDQIMEPVSSPDADRELREFLGVAGGSKSLRIVREFRSLRSLDKDVALGLRLQLLRNEQVVATASTWSGNNDAVEASEPLEWESGEFDPRLMHSSDRWVLRVTGDARLALRAFDDLSRSQPDRTKYWSGTFEIPLKLSDTGRYAVQDRPGAPWQSGRTGPGSGMPGLCR